ncbi:MAG TPA: c-type cytochrome biogenesis protein CcmI [Rubrivivax sp.]|nr:c-type cytochrome biogenesis protein CcmI [Rubrivivax sp.]
MAAWFWAGALALLLLALWLVPLALWRRPARSVAPGGAGASNLQVLRAQRLQLDEELAQGGIDAAQHRALRAEIERRVLEEEGVAAAPRRSGSTRGTVWLLLVAMPVLALGLYALLGNPAALAPPAPQQAQGQPTPQEVEAMVAKLAERMESRPPGNVDDLEGWVMLGRSYAVMQRYPEAGRAFERALQLAPGDAQLLVDRADVLAMTQGGNLRGEPLRLIEQALHNDPSNLKALALAGTAAFERGDYAGAIGYWGRARAGAPQDSAFAQRLEQGIADARAAAGGTAAAASAAAPAAAAGSISGRVSVAPALAARMQPGDTLFVYARAVDGPRMPLAILKRSAADLPLEFQLDDAMAMSPQLKLSAFADIIVSARLSRSGDAMPQSGDLEGQSPPLAGRRSGVEVLIDRVRP